MKFLFTIVLLYLFLNTSVAQNKIVFPVKSEVFCQGHFQDSEGITFTKENRLFVTADRKLWEITQDGNARFVTNLYSNLGLAPFGDTGMLVADFGPKNAFKDGRNNDGIVWLAFPDGRKQVFAKGFGDPNFILPMTDGSFLISDDATNEIFKIDSNSNVSLFTTAVNHPNGMALASNEAILYIAQIFKTIKPVVFDNRLWQLSLVNGRPVKEAEIIFSTGEGAANDGLLIDTNGRIYIAANREGKIWQYDPNNQKATVITEGVFGVASMAFGKGAFDKNYLYFTTTYSQGKGGKVYRVRIH